MKKSVRVRLVLVMCTAASTAALASGKDDPLHL